MTDAPDLKLRLADLVRLRADHAAQGKGQLVTYLDALIREIELEIAHRAAAPPPAKPEANESPMVTGDATSRLPKRG